MMNLTITIPIFEDPALVAIIIKENSAIFSKYPLVIINKSGGDQFRTIQLGIKLFDQDSTWWEARKFALDYVQTKYVLCLDLDTVLTPQYIEQAIEILESRPEVVCVAINYAEPFHQDHLAFGTSVWRLDILKQLYDWNQSRKSCECKYMWEKVTSIGMKVETLPMEAKHMRNFQASNTVITVVHSDGKVD